MEGDARRQELLRLISKSQKPISGTELAQTLHVPAHELGIYMEEDWKMNKRIRLNAGVHE